MGTIEIPVVDCCGVLGHLIPWAQWKCYENPVVPTRDFDRPHVYMFSDKGQLGIRGSQAPPYDLPYSKWHKGTVNLDNFIDENAVDGWFDWRRIRSVITATFLKANE